MNADSDRFKRLRWWFWILLFAPTAIIVSVKPLPGVITVHPGERNRFSDLVWPALLMLNAVYSLLAAAQLERVGTARRSAWTVQMAALFFLLSLVLSFGGCTAIVF